PGDLISALPDAVIHHIFSFLPLKDIVKTSVLSRQWRSTWTTTTHLVFYGFRPRNHVACSSDFRSILDSILIQCTSPATKRFHITNFKYEADRAKLDFWLRFVVGCRVDDLFLELITTKSRFVYVVRPFLHCSSWLVRLEVSWCRFSLGTTTRLPCLEFLSMAYVELESSGKSCFSDPYVAQLLGCEEHCNKFTECEIVGAHRFI
ncbi:hypothetical protein EUGRSUZ_E03795, partial [Eucalyptus grandis]